MKTHIVSSQMNSPVIQLDLHTLLAGVNFYRVTKDGGSQRSSESKDSLGYHLGTTVDLPGAGGELQDHFLGCLHWIFGSRLAQQLEVQSLIFTGDVG